MRRKSLIIVSVLFISLLLFPEGCSLTVEQPAGSGGNSGLTITAAFARENGAPLSCCTIRFSDGENSADCRSDQDGALQCELLLAEARIV